MHVLETVFEVAALILLAVLGRGVFVYFFPERDCWWCHGERRRCWRCHGTGRTWRIGARLVHKLRMSLQQAWEERGQP